MADKLKSTADSTTSSTGLPVPSMESISSGLNYAINNVWSTLSSKLDAYFPPEKRNAWKEWLTKFASEKPYMASFLLSQISLSGPPLALFLIMTLTIIIFSLLAGLLVGLLGAVFFIVLAVGFALMFILPVLFFTTAAAVFVWLFGLGTYWIVKWFNEKEVPGVHTGLKEGLMEQSGMKDLPGMNGESFMGDGDTKTTTNGANEEKPEKANRPKAEQSGEDADEKKTSAKTSGAHSQHQHHGDGKENSGSTTHPRKLATKTTDGDHGEGPKKQVLAS